jgi:hypothetical protein
MHNPEIFGKIASVAAYGSAVSCNKGETQAKFLHCVGTACALRAYCARRGRYTHSRIPVT